MKKLLLFMVLSAAPVAGWADAELFAATDVQKHFNIQEIKALRDKGLALIEPAAGGGNEAENVEESGEESGHAAATSGGEAAETGNDAATDGDGAEEEGGAAEGEAKEGGHGGGEPKATGHTERAKSHTGKEIGPMPELPEVMIGGQRLITHEQQIMQDISESTPVGLKGPMWKDWLDHRFSITPFAHDPAMGPADAKIRVVQFVDLACTSCLGELGKIDAVMADYASTTLVTHVHAPSAKFQDTNLAAFYGEVAARIGLFWQYRARLVRDKPTDGQGVFNLLIGIGVQVKDARMLMLNEARRFYREMDADAMLARTFFVSANPVVFVNGIRVGDGGIPLEKLGDVMDYVTRRLAHGLPEPPQ